MHSQDTWVVTLRSAIRTSFKDVGKGWFNLAESNMETYEFSKLRSFLTLTRFVMEDTLRFLVDDSLAKFVAFITGCCRSLVRSHSLQSQKDSSRRQCWLSNYIHQLMQLVWTSYPHWAMVGEAIRLKP